MTDNRPWLTRDMQSKPSTGTIPGECANCHKTVYEQMWILDDAYNVWKGVCPHCGAWNFLSTTHGLRGYASGGMHLVLPTKSEQESNGLPDGIPLADWDGPADMHGSPAGEILHRLRKNID